MTTSLSNTNGKSYNSFQWNTGTGTSPTDSNYGIDTVAFHFPVDIGDCDRDSSIWDYEGTRNLQKSELEGGSLVANFPCGHANVHVNLYFASSRCRIEVNAARVISPKSHTLLPPGALSRVVELILDKLTGVVTPSFDSLNEDGELVRDPNWKDQVLFTRIDVTRDFLVSNPSAVRLGLAHVKSKNQKSHKITTSPNDGWSIEFGTKYEGKDIFYDKEAELSQHNAEIPNYPEGVLYRFEGVLKKSRLVSSGMKRLSDVTDERVWSAIETRWEKTGWNTPLPGSTGLLEAVGHLSQTRMDGLLGFLHRCAAGQESSMPPMYKRDRNKLAKSCGLIPGTPIELLGKATTYLDLQTGMIQPIPLVPPI